MDPNVQAILLENQRLKEQNVYFQQFQQYYQYQQYVATQQQVNYYSQNSTIIQYPNSLSYEVPNQKTFLLCGSNDGEDWQSNVISKLKGKPVCIFNNRLPDKTADSKNIKESATPDDYEGWLIQSLERCESVVFSFDWKDNAFIVSSLLGYAGALGKNVFVNIHPANKEKTIIYKICKHSCKSSYVTTRLDKLLNKLDLYVSTGRMPESSQGSLGDDASVISGEIGIRR